MAEKDIPINASDLITMEDLEETEIQLFVYAFRDNELGNFTGLQARNDEPIKMASDCRAATIKGAIKPEFAAVMDLYFIGRFSNLTGIITPEESPKRILILKDCLKKETKNEVQN